MAFELFKRIGIEIKFSFVFICALMLSFDKTSIGFFSLVCSVLHELGHVAYIAFSTSEKIHLILDYKGIAIKKKIFQKSKLNELFMLISGSLVNFVAAFIFYIIKKTTLTLINLFIGAFNLLPLSFLDGGRIVALIFSKKPLKFVDNLGQVLSYGCLISLVALCIVLFIKREINVSFAIIILYIGIYVTTRQGID